LAGGARDGLTPAVTAFLDRFSEIAADYDAVLCDVWGVLHAGVAAYPDAYMALTRYRASGGVAILLTNAPRPGGTVSLFLDKLGLPRNAYDGIFSSGDVTRALLEERKGQKLFHIGPPRDLPIFEHVKDRFASPEDADYVVCSGLRDDEVETAENYRDELMQLRARSLPMICANPDVVVERGDKLVYCAGAVADLYAALGGDVTYAGKPYAPIYTGALKLAEKMVRRPLALKRVLAIGDSLRTDVKGAAALGIDCLFVTAGIHAEELGHRDDPQRDALERIFAAEDVRPKAAIRKLVW
jgi:HAD superfamily hydrolase (TIGR01459 family)